VKTQQEAIDELQAIAAANGGTLHLLKNRAIFEFGQGAHIDAPMPAKHADYLWNDLLELVQRWYAAKQPALRLTSAQ
jgi:hypothetical protein